MDEHSEAGRTLPQREQALRASLATLPMGVFSLDASGLCLLAEGGAFELLGLDPSTLPGQRVCETSTLPGWLCDAAREAMAGGRETRSHVSHAGREFQLTVRPLRGRADSEISWIVGSLQEVSGRADPLEREQLLAKERRARAVAESAAHRESFLSEASRKLASSLDWEITIDTIVRLAIPEFTDGCAVLIFEGGALRQVSAVHREREIHEAMQILFSRYSPDPKKPVGIGRIMSTGESLFMPEVPDEFLLALARSEEHLDLLRRMRMKSYAGVPLTAHGRVLGVLIFATLERHFTRADLALAEELGRRCAAAIENAQLYAEVRDAVKVREDFLAVASHELRTPLTPLNLLLTRLERTLGGEQREAVALVRGARRSVERLKTLVGDLLDVAQLEAGRLVVHMEQVPLAELIEQMVENYRPMSPRHTLVLDRGPGSMVLQGDRARLEQVIANLVDNAIKYSPGGGVIRVGLERHANEVVLSVSDPGIGIAPAQQERIFTRFFRSSSTPVAQYGGLGLGLYITQQIVHRHGGRIWLESELGKGSTFFVALPAS